MELVAEKLTQAVEGIYSDEIAATNAIVKENLSEKDLAEGAAPAFTGCLHSLLEYHVWRLCHKTFVYEFHLYRENSGYPVDPSSSKAFHQYVRKIDEALVSEWFEKYGLLKEMVATSVRNSCAFIEEVSGNYSDDLPLLLAQGMIGKESELQAVTPMDSDPHHGSKVNLCLEFGASQKLLYKPRSLEVDVVLHELFTDILKFKNLHYQSPVPQTINRSGYGWQAFVAHQSIDETETGEAYYNLGLCAAVFSTLGATDLHDENVIFNRSFPYFVDLETSLQPRYKRGDSLHESMEERLSDSIANTSIIPAKHITHPHEVLIGAINTPYPQKTDARVFSLKHPETDAVDLAKDTITVERTDIPLTLTGNLPPDPVPYQEAFLQGYADSYERIMEKKEQFYAKVKGIDCLVRVVVRPTTQYYLMLDACLFPENLVHETKINRILSYLKPSKLIREPNVSNEILAEEIRSLRNGDIPHFSLKSDDIRLYSGDFVSNGIFELSPAEKSMHIVLQLSKTRLLHEKRLIAEGFAEIRIHEAEYEGTVDLGHKSSLFTDVLKKVTKDAPDPLIDLIQTLAITAGPSQPETGWVGGVYGKLPISYESSGLISLHDTGGILLLLQHLAEYEDREESSQEYQTLLNQADRGLRSLRDTFSAQFDSSPMSIISGSGSLDFILNHRNNRLRETESNLINFPSADDRKEDLFIGKPGITLALASFPGTPRHLLEDLYAGIEGEEPNRFPDDGVAHGNAGLIWAGFRLAYATEDYESCRRYFEEAVQISFPYTAASAGWCNGNAGLLMMLAEMSCLLNEETDLYDLAFASTMLPADGAIDLSVCHGAAGVLQSLLFAYKALDDPRYLSLANHYWDSALGLANKNGFYTGEENRDYLLGYFLGWGGIADAAMMLKMYNEGMVTWVPLNLSSVAFQNNLQLSDYLKKEAEVPR